MTPKDTKIQGRQIALEYAKMNAVEEAGTFIESNFSTHQDSNGKSFSSHDAQAYAAGIIKTKILSTKYEKGKCIVSIEATIENDDLKNNLKNFNANKKDILYLKSKYDEYDKKIHKLNEKIKELEVSLTKKDAFKYGINEEIAKRTSERTVLVKKIKATRKNIQTYTIEKGEIAKSIAQYDVMLMRAIDDVDKNIFEPIIDNMKIKLDDIVVTTDVKNKNFKIALTVSWASIASVDELAAHYRLFEGAPYKKERFKKYSKHWYWAEDAKKEEKRRKKMVDNYYKNPKLYYNQYPSDFYEIARQERGARRPFHIKNSKGVLYDPLEVVREKFNQHIKQKIYKIRIEALGYGTEFPIYNLEKDGYILRFSGVQKIVIRHIPMKYKDKIESLEIKKIIETSEHPEREYDYRAWKKSYLNYGDNGIRYN